MNSRLKMRLDLAEKDTSRVLLRQLLDKLSSFEDCDDPERLKRRLQKARSLAEDLASVFPDIPFKPAPRPGRLRATQAALDIIADLYLRGELEKESPDEDANHDQFLDSDD